MNYFVRISNLQIVSERQVRSEIMENFATIAPASLSDSFLTPYGYKIVAEPQKPNIQHYQDLVLSEPYIHNGTIKLRWEVVNKILSSNVKAEYIEKLRLTFEEFLKIIKSTYPESEVQGWSVQKEEATNFLLNPNYPTPCLNALALNRGIDKTLLANKIIEKSNQFAHVYGTLIGTRQHYEDLIVAATRVEDLPQIPTQNTFL